MGELLEVAKVMVQPTMKLLEMCGSAIGTVYEPRHMRKMADAEAYKIKQLSGAITESDGLPISYENSEISMSTVNFEDFAKRAEFRAKYQLLREQNNIENVVSNAYQELEGAPEVVSDPVDEDWTTRFFNIVKEINTEEMQHIWGKILAGEIVRPGSFSLRTLETIRSISQVEATTFQKIVPFITRAGLDCFLTSEKSILDKYNITYGDVLLLDECGLIVSTAMLTISQSVSSCSEMFIFNDSKAMLINGTSEMPHKTDIGISPLTKAGRELYRILDHQSNEAYFIDFAEVIFQKNMDNVNITIHKLNYVDDSSINYDKTVLKEFRKIDR